MLTAGHVADRSLYYGINNPAGNTSQNSVINFQHNGVGDYALVPIAQNTPTNLLRINSTTTAKIDSFNNGSVLSTFEGRQFLKYGATTGLTAGNFAQLNGIGRFRDPDAPEYDPYRKIEIYGLTTFVNNTLIPVKPGDSGGPVWCLTASGTRELYGVISGMDSTNPHTAYFSRLQYPSNNNSYQPKLK